MLLAATPKVQSSHLEQMVNHLVQMNNPAVTGRLQKDPKALRHV